MYTTELLAEKNVRDQYVKLQERVREFGSRVGDVSGGPQLRSH